MEMTKQTGNQTTEHLRVDYVPQPNLPTPTKPVEETPCHSIIKERAVTCAQLETSVQTYSDVAFTVLVDHLPSEILLHIFELVIIYEYWGIYLGGYEHNEEDLMNSPIKIEFPKQHHTLSRVCARWQQVVTSASALWSRIDLAVSGKYKEAFYVRASHFVFRAGNAPLMIRIHEPTPPKSSDIERLMNWLAPVAGRVYSLNVLEGITTSSMVNDILNTWLKLGVPGTINELALSAGASGIYFLEPAPGSGSSSGSDLAQWKYDISLEAFESFFRPITTLRLTGVFPQWDSHAYHGLNHLHLDKGPITENQLVAVLSSSPYFCTLSFGLTVTGTAPAGTRKGPIYLRDLNILNLWTPTIASAKIVLRLIEPGSRPLKMSLDLIKETDMRDFAEGEEVQAFFGRSNVATCYLGSVEHTVSPWFPEVLRKLPHLRMLCLQGQSFLNSNLHSYNKEYVAPHVYPELRELCIIDCSLNLGALKLFLSAHSIDILRLQGCVLDSREQSDPEMLKTLEDELSKLVPNVRCYTDKGGFKDPYLN